MFAQRAFEIGWEGITLIYIAADLADPAAFAVLGLLGWLRFGLDVLLIVVVGHRGLVGQHLGIEYICYEHGVRAKVDTLGDTAGQVGIGVFRDVEHMVDGTMFSFAIGELFHLAPRLESEMLKDLHGCLVGQHADIEHTRVLDEVVRIVALVDRHSNL